MNFFLANLIFSNVDGVFGAVDSSSAGFVHGEAYYKH